MKPFYNKYGVSPKADRTVDGITFASKWEKKAYEILKEELGLENFSLQPSYELQEKFRDQEGKAIRAIKYEADFLIYDEYIVDTKGFETPVFKIKEKMFKHKFNKSIIKLKTKKQLMLFIDRVKEDKEKV